MSHCHTWKLWRSAAVRSLQVPAPYELYRKLCHISHGRVLDVGEIPRQLPGVPKRPAGSGRGGDAAQHQRIQLTAGATVLQGNNVVATVTGATVYDLNACPRGYYAHCRVDIIPSLGSGYKVVSSGLLPGVQMRWLRTVVCEVRGRKQGILCALLVAVAAIGMFKMLLVGFKAVWRSL